MALRSFNHFADAAFYVVGLRLGAGHQPAVAFLIGGEIAYGHAVGTEQFSIEKESAFDMGRFDWRVAVLDEHILCGPRHAKFGAAKDELLVGGVGDAR